MPSSLPVSASRSKVKHPDESVLFGFDFGPLLRSGETLSSVTSVTCTAAEQALTGGATVATTDLTIGSGTINTLTAFDDDEGGSVAISEGVRARISGGVAGGNYTIECTVVTSQGDTRVLVCTLQVRES